MLRFWFFEGDAAEAFCVFEADDFAGFFGPLADALCGVPATHLAFVGEEGFDFGVEGVGDVDVVVGFVGEEEEDVVGFVAEEPFFKEVWVEEGHFSGRKYRINGGGSGRAVIGVVDVGVAGEEVGGVHSADDVGFELADDADELFAEF